jgi:Methyltransferase domain
VAYVDNDPVVLIHARALVEFGTSFGISTSYLAAAVIDNGTGRVLSTELGATKIAAARSNLAEAGVAEAVTILPGDALSTLADIPGPIGLVLLDGWKDLCLPVLRLLEDRLAPVRWWSPAAARSQHGRLPELRPRPGQRIRQRRLSCRRRHGDQLPHGASVPEAD